jgi:hypothetical protein
MPQLYHGGSATILGDNLGALWLLFTGFVTCAFTCMHVHMTRVCPVTYGFDSFGASTFIPGL